MVEKFYPTKESTSSFWLDDKTFKTKFEPTEPFPEKTDIAIIGGGFCGSAVVYHLFENGCKEKVTMIEAREIASGATGRNGGHMKPYNHRHQNEYQTNFGKEEAAFLAVFEKDNMNQVKELIENENIDCDARFTMAYDVVKGSEVEQEFINDYYAFIDNPFIPESMKKETTIYFGDQAAEKTKFDSPVTITYPTGSLFPRKLISYFLEKATKAGVEVYDNTLVTSIDKADTESEEYQWTLKTAKGILKAKKVVVATNGYTKEILPEFKRKILPVKGVVTHIKHTKTEGVKNPLDNNFSLYAPLEQDYIITREDGSLIVGGVASTYLNYERCKSMIDCADDSFFPKESEEVLDDYVKKTFNLKDEEYKEYENTQTWTGVMGYANDDFPYVGELSKFGRKNLWIAAGFTGHGMPRIFVTGKNVAQELLGLEPVKIPNQFLVTRERMCDKSFPYIEELAESDPKIKELYPDIF